MSVVSAYQAYQAKRDCHGFARFDHEAARPQRSLGPGDLGPYEVFSRRQLLLRHFAHVDFLLGAVGALQRQNRVWFVEFERHLDGWRGLVKPADDRKSSAD